MEFEREKKQGWAELNKDFYCLEMLVRLNMCETEEPNENIENSETSKFCWVEY